MTQPDGHLQANTRNSRSFGRACLLLMLVLLAAAGGLASRASAQQGWTPTVATAPGGTFNGPMPGALNRQPTRIDPKYFPSPRKDAPPARHVLPHGAWSPIVTGALPRDGARPSQSRAGTGAVVAPLAGPSPVRPAKSQAAVGNTPGVDKAGTKTAEAGASVPSEGEKTDEPAFKKPGPLDALPPDASAAQQYCFNTADSAADARFAWQAKKIQEMEVELEQRAQQLEAKTEEYKRWLERRDEFSRKAHEKLVGFYSRMRADAAAGQLAELDEEMAAAVVMKLQTKVAGQIMGEMDPERAAKIATIISGAGKIPHGKRRAAAPAAAAPPPDATPEAQDATSPPEGPRS